MMSQLTTKCSLQQALTLIKEAHCLSECVTLNNHRKMVYTSCIWKFKLLVVRWLILVYIGCREKSLVGELN